MDDLRKTPEHNAYYEAIGIVLIEVMRRFPRESQYTILRHISSMAALEAVVIGDKDLEQLAREFYESQQLHESRPLHEREQ